MFRTRIVSVAAATVVTAGLLLVPTVQAGAATAPPQVTHVHGTSVSTTSATIAWTAPKSGAYAGAVVRFARGSHAPTSVTAGHAAAVKGATAALSGLTAGTHFSVSVFSSDGHGTYSKPVLYSFVARPAGVTNLTVTVTGTTATLHWTNPPAGFYSGVVVAYAGFGEPVSLTKAPGGNEVGRAKLSSATATSATIKGVKPGSGDVAQVQTYGASVWTYNSQHNYSARVGTRFASNAIFGVVRDSQGRPLPDVYVHIAERGHENDYRSVPFPPLTADDGTYVIRLSDPSVGHYDVCAEQRHSTGSAANDPGLVPTCWKNTVFDGVVPSSNPTRYPDVTAYDLDAGQAITVSSAYTAQTNITMATGGVASGTVRSAADNKAVKHVDVRIHDRAGKPVYTSAERNATYDDGEYTTDSQGHWSVDGLAAGDYYIELVPSVETAVPGDPANDRGFAPKWIGQGTDAPGTTGRTLIHITQGRTTSTTISLNPSAVVNGTVTYARTPPQENNETTVYAFAPDGSLVDETDAFPPASRSATYSLNGLNKGDDYDVCIAYVTYGRGDTTTQVGQCWAGKGKATAPWDGTLSFNGYTLTTKLPAGAVPVAFDNNPNADIPFAVAN